MCLHNCCGETSLSSNLASTAGVDRKLSLYSLGIPNMILRNLYLSLFLKFKMTEVEELQGTRFTSKSDLLRINSINSLSTDLLT